MLYTVAVEDGYMLVSAVRSVVVLALASNMGGLGMAADGDGDVDDDDMEDDDASPLLLLAWL